MTSRIAGLAAAGAVVFAVAASVGGCDRGRNAPSPLPAGAVTDPPPAAPPPVPVDPALRYLTLSAPLRRTPAEPPRGKADARAAPPPPVAFLHRGERVTWLETQGDWTRVRASDGAEGWLRTASLLPASEVTEGTVLAPSWAFDRPDLLAVNARRKVEPGTLLLVVKTRDLFTEVDVGTGTSAWVLSSHVVTRPEEVMAAKLVEKARWLAKADRPDEAKEVLALLRASRPDSPLVAILAVELGEAPPPGPEGATGPTGPTGATGPAAGGAPGPSGPTGPAAPAPSAAAPATPPPAGGPARP